jgi:hypothetical protein
LRSKSINSYYELQTLLHELSWSLGAKRNLWSKFHSILKSREEILLNFKPRKFSEFSFEIHFESGEAHMEKVDPFFHTFTTIFYFKKIELERPFLDGSKFEMI